MLHLTNQFKRLGKQSLHRWWFSDKKPEEKSQKVFIDEESIQRKIKELKEKSQTISSEEKYKKKKEFMPTFTIPEVNEKVNQFRKQSNTEELFSFSDITLEQKPTLLQITGYDPQFIQVDNFQYPPSVILTPNQVLNWEVESPQMLKIQNFAILKCLQPIPDYVIIGVPDSTVIKNELRAQLKQLHSNMDILDLFEAISQFNTVTDNDKYCIAFLMSS